MDLKDRDYIAVTGFAALPYPLLLGQCGGASNALKACWSHGPHQAVSTHGCKLVSGPTQPQNVGSIP